MGFSSCGARAAGCLGSVVLWHVTSVVVARRLSCPAACGILVPRPGIEPASPALEGGFFTTGPLGKSLGSLLTFKEIFAKYPRLSNHHLSISHSFKKNDVL